MTKRLTVKAIENLKPSSARREVPDGEVRGMYTCIQPSGAKSFILRYRHAGRPRKLTIGSFEMGLGEARKRAEAHRVEIAKGGDPAGARAADKTRQADTVEAVVAKFIARHVTPSNKPSTAKEFVRQLEKEIVGRWRGRRLADIARRDVNAMLDEIVDRGSPIASNRVFSIFRKLCRWAAAREIIERSPCDGVQVRGTETPRDRVLDDRELRLIWAASDTLGFPFGAIVKLLTLTGQRRGEVAGMRWSEIDLDKRIWSLPGERVKNKRPHVVPLAPAAVDILKGLPRFETDLLFPTREGSGPVSGFSAVKSRLDRAVAEAVEHDQSTPLAQWGFHDLRRSTASGMARLGVDLVVIEKTLNHVRGSFGGIVSVYQKFKYEDATRRALEVWAAHVEALVSGAPAATNVVEFTR
jgi:integrase